ncbi:MAG TPA: hypothetical protein VGP64_14445 [Polyangia bacterium]
MKHFSLKASAPAVAAFVLLGGCGLISSDISKLTFDLPTETYTLDTAQWSNLPKGTIPPVPCMSATDCCTAATLTGSGIDCSTLTCNASSLCEVDVPESAASPVNLAMQVPALQGFAGHALSSITISSISYMVSNNSLNVDLPPLTIYLAPDNVTDPTDPRAEAFGTIPAIPAGTDPSGMVVLVPNAAQIFSTFTANVSTPFTIIAAGTVAIPSGSSAPSGAVTLSVTGTVSAQI